MLQNMHIKNIALIDEIDINFEENLNILTGETGAGKSIIIGSLGICLGGKFPKELLRNEDQDGVVELLFSIENEALKENIEELGIDCSYDELLISRRLNSKGKTVSKINGGTVTTAILKQVAGMLIDLHAQHEQQTLLKEDKHLEILDRFAGEDVACIKAEVKSYYKEYISLKKELEAVHIDESQKNKQIDFLKFEIAEIENANLKSGEDDCLEAFYKKASNAKEIIETADAVYKMTGSNVSVSAQEQIGHSILSLKGVADIDEDLLPMYDLLLNIEDMLGDFNRELSSYIKSMEFDEREFMEAEQRLNEINSLKAKYGFNIKEILDSKKQFEEELVMLQNQDEYIEELKHKIESVSKKLEKSSNHLTLERKKAAKALCEIIKKALEELNFMSVKLDMSFENQGGYTANGVDAVCFMISTNVGESMRPLSEVASGGELSRVMLAIKSCLANQDDTPTLVFDEIDVGISGRTAQKVAERLSIIAKEHQVICITHLPQIAAMSDSHYLIEKNVENNKTVTNIKHLTEEEEIEEIARLIGGAKLTEATFASAREMKGLANSTKLY